MPDWDWKKDSTTVVISLATTVSSTATEHPEIARTSINAQYIMVNNFYFAESLDAVSDRVYEELQSKVVELEKQIEAIQAPTPPAPAFDCKHQYEQCVKMATTKSAKYHCLMTYFVCLTQGYQVHLHT